MLVLYAAYSRKFVQILGKYIRKETFSAFLAILLVLFVFTVGTSFASTLRIIARGALPASMLYVELGLRSIDVLTLLLPLSLYMAVLFKLAQMYRNQEMIMFHSSGVSSKQILKMYLPMMLVFSTVLLALSLFVIPLASRTSERLTIAASKDISLMGLKEGVFQELSGSNSIIYIRKINSEEKRLENIFVNVRHEDRVDTLTAEYGFQYEDKLTKQRYISLFNGFRNEGIPGTRKYNLMKFSRNDIKLPQLKGKAANVDEDGKTLKQLLESNRPVDKAEIHERISPAITVMVLMLLALSISKSSPRDAKFGSLILGLLILTAYLNLLTIAYSLIAQSKVPPWVGAWWVHLIFITFGFWRIHKSDSSIS